MGGKVVPHILLILADDLGWNAPSWRNPSLITPNLEELRAQGVELTEHYTYRFCSPSRSALLSGRLPYRHGATDTNLAPIDAPGGLDLSYSTLGVKLQELGYVTHHVGKWHLGFCTKAHLPVSRGFNTSFGFLGGGEDHYNQSSLSAVCGDDLDLWEDDRPAGKAKTGRWTSAMFCEHAVSLIESHDTSGPPFFLYYASHDTHGSIQAPERLVQQYLEVVPPGEDQAVIATFNAMVTALDEVVGNITRALKKADMWSRSIVVWTSDNGAEIQSWTTLSRCLGTRLLPDGGFTPATHHYCAGGSNSPLRGSKASNWEGGVRTPALVSGPWVPEAVRGTSRTGLLHIVDWYATLVEGLAGGDAKDPDGIAPVDSTNLWGFISGSEQESPRVDVALEHSHFAHNGVYLEYPWGALRTREGWKLIVSPNETNAGWYGEFTPNATVPFPDSPGRPCPPSSPCLYNVREDPGEHHDVARNRPDIVQDMLSRWAKLADEYHPPVEAPVPNRSAYCAARARYGGFIGPWL